MATLDPNKLTQTQRQWVARRGETLRVHTAGGRVMNTDVPTPVQRFKQFCYAVDSGLYTVLGSVQDVAQPEAAPPADPSERPAVRDNRQLWEAHAAHVGVENPQGIKTKDDLIAAVDAHTGGIPDPNPDENNSKEAGDGS